MPNTRGPNVRRIPPLAAALVASFLLAPVGGAQTTGRGGEGPPPSTPVAVESLLYEQPFTVEKPFTTWGRERAQVSKGVLVVVAVDPALVDPRDAVVNPVLYAGNAVVIRLNHGNESGRVVGIVPGDFDPASDPIWFGSPELPERVTEDTVRAERSRAEKVGMRPPPAAEVSRARRPAVAATDLAALLRDVAAPLVDEFAPEDREIADGWRLPTAAAPSNRPK